MNHVDVRQAPVRRARADWQKEARSRAILDAAERLFVERDAAMPTVEQVARRVGVAKGTVYLYFPTKEAIFLAAFRRRCLAWLEDLQERLQLFHGRPSTDELMGIFLAYPAKNQIVLDLARFAGPLLQSPQLQKIGENLKSDIVERGRKVVATLEASYPELTEDRASHALRMCYAYLLGLWQVSDMQQNELFERMSSADAPGMSEEQEPIRAMPFTQAFCDQAREGMSVLWSRCLA